MTKQEILEYFKDINHAYNESTRLDDLSHMLDELMQSNSDEDCINRQVAIRIAEQGQIQGYEWQFKELIKLPSVNPQEPCEDAISREEAIKAIYGYSINIEMSRGIGQYKTQITDMLQSVHEMQKKLIENLPSVQPKQMTAHWIKRRDEETPTYYYQCDMCLGYSDCDSDYCPDCGRRMVEEE